MVSLRKKKTEESSANSPGDTALIGRLQELCGGDQELYSALSHLMFLDPKKMTVSLENILSEARDYESKGNSIRAEVGYRIAGGISLYRGDLDGVKMYFMKAASFVGDSRPEYGIIGRRAQEAVSVASKYYESSEPSAKM